MQGRTYDLLRKSSKRAKIKQSQSGAIAIAIFHATTKPVSRTSGRTAVAAAAYRSASTLVHQETGTVHDYSRRSGVVSAELIMPPGQAPADRETLWNAAEAAEKRKDARTAREWVVALPAELDSSGRRELAQAFAGELAKRYQVAVDLAIHAPDRGGDHRNHHAHLLLTTLSVSRDDACELVLGDKTDIELSDRARKARGLGRASEEVAAVRELWSGLVNGALARAGVDARIDHRSLEAQRQDALDSGDLAKAVELDRVPTKHLGVHAIGFERRTGLASDKRIRHEADAASRELTAGLDRSIDELTQEIDRLRADLSAHVEARQQAEVRAGMDKAKSSYEQWKAAEAARKQAEQSETQEQGIERRQRDDWSR